MAVVASRLSGIPWSFTAHRWDIVENNLLRLKVNEACMVRFISRSGLEMARLLNVPELESKASVLHMGVDVPAAAATPLVAPDLRLLCPAQLVPVKGHAYLLEALALLHQRGTRWRLQIAGDGRLRDRLQQHCAALHIAGLVTFMGRVPHGELLAAYARGDVDVVVLPSVDLGGGEHEGIPVALMEAMAYGIPVIATATGGIPELLQNDSGIMVPPEDAWALADAIGRLALDPVLRRKLGHAGRAHVEEAFSMQGVVAQLAEQIRLATASPLGPVPRGWRGELQ